MKTILLTFLLSCFVYPSQAQHCPWCCVDCRIYIVKDLSYSPDSELTIYLVDTNGKVLKDYEYKDTIFFIQQKKPYPSSIHSLIKRNDLPVKERNLIYSDFDSPKYYIAMIQGLNLENNSSFQLCIENSKSRIKRIVPFDKRAVMMCISYIHIKNNVLLIEPEELRRAYKENLFNYIKSN